MGSINDERGCKVKAWDVLMSFDIIKTRKVRHYLSEITSKFYQLKPKNIIAVTGTNGKTSVADFFYQILDINNIPAAFIGTLGIRYRKKFIRYRWRMARSNHKSSGRFDTG